ncbi:MAG: aminotransferase class V-fold PLP-dependent enzyme [Proteobacteria bacterium]|nr:aminotransferase class V-fold PLP-dependent enzyme [Pseudomonadota bacterium]
MEEELEKYQWILRRLPKPLLSMLEARIKRDPKFKARLEEEDRKLAAALEHSLKPYHSRFERHSSLPAAGIPRDQVLAEIRTLSELEAPKWREGFVSGGIYHGDESHISLLNEVYALHSQSNPLHSDLFPSATKFEAEIVSMVAGFLGRGESAPDVCGTVTSGGTESILVAMKTYRDRARRLRGIRKPEIVAPVTAHAAFDKAAEYFGMKLVHVPVGADFRVDVREVRKAVGRRTVAIVGSAPAFPHGAIDPIAELSEIAQELGAGLHVDACLGGFILPFAEKLGVPVPSFDFRLKGVTSMSVDTHKYGYAAKGTSVVLYRDPELRREQFFTITDWPGGLYFSPTLSGSRPGALSAACWAAMMSIGEAGYLNATREILSAGKAIKEGIRGIPGLKVLGDPLWVVAFASDEVDIYEVMDQMTNRGWSLNGLHRPNCVHIAVTLRHARPGVVERFLGDLRESVRTVRESPKQGTGMAPVYGMASSLPFRGLVSDLLKKTLEVLYKV